MKIAIVHDLLSQFGGAERVLDAIAEIFPNAPIYTVYCNPDALREKWKAWDIRQSGIARFLPFKKKFFRHYFFLYPFAIEHFDLREYELVISSSYLFAKSVLTSPYTCHICYCHTPMRQAWDLYFDYRNTYAKLLYKPIYDLIFHYIRIYDVIAANRVDYFIANSEYVRARIWKTYRRQSEVIYPPVDWDSFSVSDKIDDYYLCVSRLVPYKRIDLPIRAFNELGKKLVVIGDGPMMRELKRIARRNIYFIGRVPDNELKRYLSRAVALIYPSLEDFGLATLEAQASGRPVIVFSQGGAKEAIVDGKTGITFDEPTPQSIINAVKRIESIELDPYFIRQHAQKFDRKIFQEKFLNFAKAKMEEFFQKK